ncbi:hypothetical protein SLEP1_g36301 [Rubroshorea leprosula]|uniref:Uncharacterized protein n=1 Tax=Rubroshorea leprosula TaxID=152421 RepID=A0AAV5KR70_9ROSI|nr:hypothetical protein SLEP1_g36301 [Rubroshorea leprosula]
MGKKKEIDTGFERIREMQPGELEGVNKEATWFQQAPKARTSFRAKPKRTSWIMSIVKLDIFSGFRFRQLLAEPDDREEISAGAGNIV